MHSLQPEHLVPYYVYAHCFCFCVLENIIQYYSQASMHHFFPPPGLAKDIPFLFDSPNFLWQQEEEDEVMRMRNTPDFFNKLVDSICPTVFGHQEIKRAVLLMLLGGVHKLTHEGINLRGDINVCIVGDPSCAKSQFLKYVYLHLWLFQTACFLHRCDILFNLLSFAALEPPAEHSHQY